MKDSIKVINSLLMDSFDNILTLEKNAVEDGPFKDLTLAEIHAIEAINSQSGTMTEIAGRLGITVGSLTVTINRLVKKEYVARSYTEKDRRCVNLSLTRKGRLANKVHDYFHVNMVKKMIVDLNEEEIKNLIQSLEELTRFFKEEYPKSF